MQTKHSDQSLKCFHPEYLVHLVPSLPLSVSLSDPLHSKSQRTKSELLKVILVPRSLEPSTSLAPSRATQLLVRTLAVWHEISY